MMILVENKNTFVIAETIVIAWRLDAKQMYRFERINLISPKILYLPRICSCFSTFI